MRPSNYYIMVGIYGNIGDLAIDRIGRACTFTIRDEKVKDFERLYGYGAPGVINIRHEWVKNR